MRDAEAVESRHPVLQDRVFQAIWGTCWGSMRDQRGITQMHPQPFFLRFTGTCSLVLFWLFFMVMGPSGLKNIWPYDTK